ncbi:hypothetical protein GCM10009868_39860 [Terrabacter aerolatus]|uniref:Uncharacterized protein n=1 Tax=Terrabacter aerolatus TaxID=422442 RepID=A0A512D092_9MICO|nr:SRPBCC family protein [Terrabacter aerolatus]GEO29881.1 hypothetical protein TAE01_16910 [Terrabacter aerolatus]
MTWQRTHSQHLAADPETVWSVVGDPRRWLEWCAAIHAVTLDGEPRSGGGRHSTSDVLREAGFPFAHPTLDGALDDLLG